jgi:hypothetical protein
MTQPKKPAAPAPVITTGLGYPALANLDKVVRASAPTFANYLAGASDYVVNGRNLPVSKTATSKSAKAAQSDLSRVLGGIIARELEDRHRKFILKELGPQAFTPPPGQRKPHVLSPVAAETKVAGGLRTAQSDVTESHPLDGVRLAIEIKPSFRAVGRAIWNRFGDVRAFAVNIHLKFPFGVVGGIQVIPTEDFDEKGNWVDNTNALQRAARRLARIRLRETEADADHLLEAFLLLAFDPKTANLAQGIPPTGSPLHWDKFLDRLVSAYDTRFGAD